jgi:iron-sulfur cluster assembly protein
MDTTTTNNITLTTAAIEAFQKKLEERRTPNAYIRLGIKGSGCSGYQYAIQYEDDPPRENDLQFVFGGVCVVVDPKSVVYLNGSVLDFEKTLMEQGFKFNNPNVKSLCGCGSSFEIRK